MDGVCRQLMLLPPGGALQPHQIKVAGPKIYQNVNYTQRDDGGAEGPERHGGAKRRSAEGVGSGEGRRSLSPVRGSGALPPENFEI